MPPRPPTALASLARRLSDEAVAHSPSFHKKPPSPGVGSADRDLAALRAALASLSPRQLARVLQSAGVDADGNDGDVHTLVEAGVLAADALARDGGGVAAHRSVAKPPPAAGAIRVLARASDGSADAPRAPAADAAVVPTPADADAAASADAAPDTPTGGAQFARDAVVALNSEDSSVVAMAAWCVRGILGGGGKNVWGANCRFCTGPLFPSPTPSSPPLRAVTRWLTLRPSQWAHITDSRAVEPLVAALLAPGEARACACAALALRAYASAGGADAQAEAARAGAVGAAVAALAPAEDDAAWTDAARSVGAAPASALAARASQSEAVVALLGALTRGNDALKLAAVCAGAVPILASLLGAPSPQLAAAAAASLQPLTSLPAARDRLRAAPGALPALCRLLTTRVAGAPRSAAASLQNLALDAESARALADAGAVPALARALAGGAVGKTRAAACAALANLAALDAESAVPALASSGALDICLAMLARTVDRQAPKDAAIVLFAASETDAGRAALVGANAPAWLASALADGGAAARLPTLDVAHRLAVSSPAVSSSLISRGLLASLLAIARADPDARNRALGLLHALASSDPHAPAALGAAGAADTFACLAEAAADEVEELSRARVPVPRAVSRLLARAVRLLTLTAAEPDNHALLAPAAPALRRLARRLMASPHDGASAAGLDLWGAVA